jgi:pimeloyl-ACP methyl ester carboxylesterase
MRNEVRLSSGTVRYQDSGSGPVVVFVHGLFVDSELWRKVVDAIGEDFRCVRPDLPLGAHVVAASAAADLSPVGIANLLGEFLDALDLHDVTLVANDTGGAITQILLAKGCDRVGRVVLTPCDSFDNFLPKSIRALTYAARIPGLLSIGVQPLRWGWVRRIGFHWLAVRPIPADVLAAWFRPLITDRRIRRDTTRFLRSIDNRDTMAAADRLRSFTRPVLLLWPRKLPYFPFAHAQRWTTILSNARLVEVPDSYTFLSEDQPDLLAREIAVFIWDDANAATSVDAR